MKYISLSQGKVTIVDDKDYEYLNQWKWQYHNGYAVRDNARMAMHRLVIKTPKGKITDHINGNKLDNRQINLRVCNTRQNGMNRKLGKNTTSGFKGVSRFKRDNKWMGKIMFNGKRLFLGTFTDAREAAIAYNQAAKRYFGEFAQLNKI